MALHQSEWLHEAQKLAIGTKARVYHGAERRPNLVVFNKADGWSCYCHSCHEGGFVRKEVVRAPTTVHLATPTNGTVLKPLLPVNHSIPYPEIVNYAHGAGVSLQLIIDWGFKYDAARNRLVYVSDTQTVGRSLTPSKVKWLRYHGTSEFIMIGGLNQGYKPVVILTEDLVSALKIHHAINTLQPAFNAFISVVACMGTRMSTELTVGLSKSSLVLLAMDGDKAGYEANVTITRRLNLFGVKSAVVRIDEGKDPKHLTYETLLERITEWI